MTTLSMLIRKSVPGAARHHSQPTDDGRENQNNTIRQHILMFFYWVTTFLLSTVCSGLSAGCCGQHGLHCCNPRSSKMPSWHRSLRLSNISFHSFLFVIIFALPTKSLQRISGPFGGDYSLQENTVCCCIIKGLGFGWRGTISLFR